MENWKKIIKKDKRERAAERKKWNMYIKKSLHISKLSMVVYSNRLSKFINIQTWEVAIMANSNHILASFSFFYSLPYPTITIHHTMKTVFVVLSFWPFSIFLIRIFVFVLLLMLPLDMDSWITIIKQ